MHQYKEHGATGLMFEYSAHKGPNNIHYLTINGTTDHIKMKIEIRT
jgi:hypothetical protein